MSNTVVYTTTATATNSTTNEVTVASITNMASGLPITFSGNVFGNIVSGYTYYIGIVDFPNSAVTLNTYPQGPIYPLANASGSMGVSFTVGGQYIINTGAAPDDGTGDPLRTAFTDTNVNFDQIFAAGPVGSNIQITNNSILVLNTNGNLILAPNGTGVVQSNAHIFPDQTRIRNLGSSTNRWLNVYTQYLDSAQINLTGDLTVGGNLTVTGNTIEVGNIVTDSKTIELSNTATTSNIANGSGIIVGQAGSFHASLLYNSSFNSWSAGNVGFHTSGNIFGNLVAPGSNGQVLYNRNGIISASPNDFSYDQTNQTLYLTVASISGDTVGSNGLFVGIPAFTYLGSNIVSQFSSNVADYSQLNFQNISNSNIASSDYIITANDGTDTDFFLDLGLAGSGWDGTQNNSLGNALQPHDGYLYVQDGNLVIGVKNNEQFTWKFDNTGTMTAPPGSNFFGAANILVSGYVEGNTLIANNQLVVDGVANINGSLSATGDIDSGGNINATSGWLNAAAINTSGYIQAGSQLNSPQLNVYGNSTLQNTYPQTSNAYDLGSPTYQWNNLYMSGNISAQGSITTGSLISNTTIIATGNIRGGNLNVNGLLSATGTITTTGNMSTLGNVVGGNLLTAGIVSAVGNVYGDYIFADDNVLANGNITGGNLLTAGNVYGTVGYNQPNFITPFNGDPAWAYGLFSDGTNVFTQIKMWGGGDTHHGFRVYDAYGSGNVYFSVDGTGATHLNNVNATGYVSTTGNTTGGNLLTAGIVSATGNISGNYILGNIAFANGVPATYGNSNVVTLLSAFGSNSIYTTGTVTTGNVSVGFLQLYGSNNTITTNNGSAVQIGQRLNMNSTAFVSGNLNAQANLIISGATTSSSSISATGNITGGNILTAGLISAGGNVTAQNFIGNISVTGNVVGTSPNVTITAGTYVWTFDNTGNLSIPAAGDLVLSNAQSTITAVGNIYGGNLITTNTLINNGISTSGNVTVSGANAITMPNRVAFRVYGSGNTNPNATTVLNGNNWTVDYQQGTSLNSTTGIFTAPVAGLYQINVVGRSRNNTVGLSQLTCQKISANVTTNQTFLEFSANTTMGHAGTSSVSKLAVGDQLQLTVVAGNITFDSNDNWSVVYLG